MRKKCQGSFMKKTKNKISQSMLMLVFIIISGGLQDAYSYFCRNGVFANAQTGNIVFLSVNLVNGDMAGVFRARSDSRKNSLFPLRQKKSILERGCSACRIGYAVCGRVYAAKYESVRQCSRISRLRDAGAFVRPDLRQRFRKHDVYRKYRPYVGFARYGDRKKR